MGFFQTKLDNYTFEIHYGNIIIVSIIIIFLFYPLGLGMGFIGRNYNRYQIREDAKNEVSVNEIRIRQQEQLIQVEKQKAEIRIVEAGGIAESQKIINMSLTNNYLQYLAIQAQEKMASSPNHTQIYIPVGTNGIPLIKTIDN